MIHQEQVFNISEYKTLFDELDIYKMNIEGKIISRNRNGNWYVRKHSIVNGYHRICLRMKNNRYKNIMIGQMIMHLFIQPRPSLRHAVGFKDGDPGNLKSENMFWGTWVEIKNNSIKLDAYAKGETCALTKHTEEKIQSFRKEYWNDPKEQNKKALAYGFSSSQASNIINRRIWKHLPKVENEP